MAWHHLWVINPFAPKNFAEKHALKLFKPFSGHCLSRARARTYHKAI